MRKESKLIIFVLAWIATIGIVGLAPENHPLLGLAFVIPALAGFLWVFGWIKELLLVKSRTYQASSALAFVFLTFAIVGAFYATGFMAGARMGFPIANSQGSLPGAKFGDYMYFSVVTGTTLGYGDLFPTKWGRLLACLEVVQFLIFIGVGGALLARAFQPEELDKFQAAVALG